jgi:hypothetical protein
MGRIYSLTLTLFLFSFIFAHKIYCQRIQSIDKKILEKPYRATKGQTLNIQCDTVVLINAYHYQLYEKARISLLSTDFEKYNEVFNAYETQSKLYKQWNDSLQLKYMDISTMFKNSIENTQNSLISIKDNLSAAKDSLNTANQNLTEAMQHLNTAKHEKWFYASVGFLLGTLITVIVVPK